ncbi:hypothetical protein WAI453_011168 [Rhynchosporium graminicola]
MFRFIRPRQPLISISRLPLKLEAQRQGGELSNFQVVSIKRARAGIKTIIGTTFAIYIGTTIYSKAVLDPLTRAAAEILNDLPADESEEEAEPLFIPFPGTTKQLPVVPYRGSDPEWQEFIKFSRDKKLAQNVREDLAGYVASIAAKHPLLAARCGTDMKLRRFWLDVDFPPAPPPEFERKGLELGTGVTTRTVDSATVFKIRQGLWPSAVMKSFWSFVKVAFADDTKRVAAMLGIGSASPPLTFDQLLAQHQQLIQDGQAPPLPAKASTPGLPPQGSKEMIDTSAGKSESAEEESEPKDIQEVVIRINSRTMAIYAHFFRPIMAFKAKLAQTWKPILQHPPRGSILVSGLVELDSPKATLVFDVRAAYNPKTKEYDPSSLLIQLRRLQPKKQSPAR